MKELLSDVLRSYLDQTHTGTKRLSDISKIPKKSLDNWLSGHVLRPRLWQDVVKVATALHLDEAQTDRLLRSAGHEPVRHLLASVQGNDQALLAPWNGLAKSLPQSAAPFQAPRDLPTFVGRQDEIATLRSALLGDGHAVIFGVRGMGGVGKSALAAHIAYQLRNDFPDGVLWARLDTSDTLSILSLFAGAFGKDVGQYQDVESRAAAVRAVLADKRALIVLDNVERGEQVQPLLPPSGGRCAVLVTTRNDLDATDGWAYLMLDGFSAQRGEAMLLFEKQLGRAPATRHRGTLTQIAVTLGQLPLAVAMTGGQLAFAFRSAQWGEEKQIVQDTLQGLQVESERLSRLQRGTSSVRTSFNISYRALTVELQRCFAALGVFGGADFSTEAVAYVWDTSTPSAQTDLKTLATRSLVQPSRDGRYRLHPLLRDFARERLTESDATERTYDERCAAYFADFVQQHKDDYPTIDLEFGNIMSALRVAHDRQLTEAYLGAAHDLLPYLRTRGLYDHGKTTYEEAIQMAEVNGDDNELALSLHDLASIVVKQGDYDATITLTERSLEIATRLDNRLLQYRLLAIFALVTANQGRFRDMVLYCEQGLTIARELNDHGSLCTSYVNLGVALANLGDFVQSERYQAEGLRMAKEGGYSEVAMAVSHNLGCLLRDAGRVDEARACFEDGMRLARQVGHRERLCHLLLRLGEMDSEAGRYGPAEAALTEAMALAEVINMPWTISTSAFSLCGHRLRLGQVAEAANLASRGMTIARKIGSTELIADGLLAQSKVHFAKGERERAIVAGQESLGLYEQQGMNKAEPARKWLELIA